jgi:hypothetical protein
VKRFLLSSLAAGLAYTALGGLFVYCLLPTGMQTELWLALAGGSDLFGPSGVPRRYAQYVESDDIHLHVHATYLVVGWPLLARQAGLHIGFGLLTMTFFAFLQRNGPRLGAARIAALVIWLLAFVGLSLRMHFATSLRWMVAGLVMAWGLIETQIAAHLGAFVWGRTASEAA